jgi:hypothetical protein
MKTLRNYEQLAIAITAKRNCLKFGSTEYTEQWDDIIDEIMEDAPSGSGFDNGTIFDEEKSDETKLVFYTSFHHMNEGGYYDGWTDHTVTIRANFVIRWSMTVSGRNRNEIKEYIAETFNHFLNQEYTEKV